MSKLRFLLNHYRHHDDERGDDECDDEPSYDWGVADSKKQATSWESSEEDGSQSCDLVYGEADEAVWVGPWTWCYLLLVLHESMVDG